MPSAASRITHYVSRSTLDARRPTLHAPRSTPQSAVALVITLVLLSVITFMAVTFLVVSRAQHGAVATETDQQTARFAADTARERAIAELLAPILATTNEFNYGLLVSVNYINMAGFDPALPVGIINPLNVNYDYTSSGVPLTLIQQQQNLANLLYNPRPPVFVVTNALAARSNEFRFFLDLNRNGAFEPSGLLTLTNSLGVPTATPPVMSPLVGDPQWIGGLQRPEFAHSATNFFTHRYAYLVVPAGQTLDLNCIHNQAGNQGKFDPQGRGFRRNQGVGTFEINLAAFLYDLNTNYWSAGYIYDPIGGFVNGTPFADAAALLGYRYAYNPASGGITLASVTALFPGNVGNNAFPGTPAFQTTPIDGYSAGPVMTGTWWTPPAGFNTWPAKSWSGADNPNRFYSIQDLFDQTKTTLPAIKPPPWAATFTGRLSMAGTNTDTYNRYTFYRLLSQLSTDSAPEPPGKMNLNYCNVDNNGNVVTGMETNFIPWTPTQFFTNAAIRLLANAGYTVGPANSPTNLLVLGSNYVNGTYVYTTNLHIPLWPTNYYTPSVQRLLQLAANIYDSTTNQSFGQATAATNGFPSVFRPVFSTLGGRGGGPVAIVGYTEVTDANTIMSLPQTSWVDLTLPPSLWQRFLRPNSMVYGIPLVIGAKKGYPNFNELVLKTSVQITRKLQLLRQNGNNNGAIVTTNQMYVVAISNVFGIEAWNSYSTPYPRNLTLTVLSADVRAYLTDAQKNYSWSYPVTIIPPATNIVAYNWPGFIDQRQTSSRGSFVYPLLTNLLTPTNSQYLQSASPPQLVPVIGQGAYFENPSGFQSPDWWLSITNRLRFAIVDTSVTPNRIVDFVNLEGIAPWSPLHLTQLMGADVCTGANAVYDYNGDWCTNTGSGVVPLGVLNQINTTKATPPNPWSNDPNNGPFRDFFRFQFGLSVGNTNSMVMTNTFYAKASTFVTNFFTTWQVNDPLVHYTVADLTAPVSTADPTANLGKGTLNDNYRPWGGNPGKRAAETIVSVAYKDPVAFVQNHSDDVGHSDDWDFPTNKFPNVGWLGRVHRGTPWQSVYLKASSIDFPTWQQKWTRNFVVVTNFGQFSTNIVLPGTAVYYPYVAPTATITFSNGVAAYDAYFTLPTTDWHFLDLFTTGLSDSATRGQLSINQTSLAAWSAALTGISVLTNTTDASGNPILASQLIEPAGVYDPSNTNTWAPIVQIVNNINNIRAAYPNGAFHTLGDLLAVPALTIASPFLNPNGIPLSDPTCVLNDAAFERLPQQILGLLKCDHTPRFVIYAFGQTLKPESTRAIVKSGLYAGMCTNYQIVAEAATRTVVRFEGVPQFLPGRPPAITNLHPVIESFTVLPPD